MSRAECISRKIKTNFGSVHTHVDFVDGKVVSVNVSVPGHKDNTAVEHAICEIAESIRQSIKEVIGRDNGHNSTHRN